LRSDTYARPAPRIASISGLPRETDVADDEYVRVPCDGLQLFRAVSAVSRMPSASSCGRHRRIDVRIATGDAMAGRLRDRSNAPHERAADAEDMQMHVWQAVCSGPAVSERRAARPRTEDGVACRRQPAPNQASAIVSSTSTITKASFSPSASARPARACAASATMPMPHCVTKLALNISRLSAVLTRATRPLAKPALSSVNAST